jgi:hypothetical protein
LVIYGSSCEEQFFVPVSSMIFIDIYPDAIYDIASSRESIPLNPSNDS